MLTLCVITKNEERHIDKCLSSCLSICDEIIIVDSGSSDKTIEIANKYGAKIFSIDWIDDYSFARNAAINEASGDWIIFLDADEYLVNPELIKSAIKNAKPNLGGFIIERKDAFLDLATGKYCEVPVGIIRVFQNRPEFRFEEPVHEIIGPSILRNDFNLGVIERAHIHHNISSHSKTFLFEKQRKYLSILNSNLSLRNSTWLKYQKAKTLWFFDKAQDAISMFIEVSKSNDFYLSVASLNNLGAIYCNQNDFNNSEYYLSLSSSKLKNQSQVYFLLGDMNFRRGHIKEALRNYKNVNTKLVLDNSDGFIPGVLFLYPYQKVYRFALCFYHKVPFLAFLLCKISLLYNPNYVDSLFLLARFYNKINRKKRSDMYVQKIFEVNPTWKIEF